VSARHAYSNTFASAWRCELTLRAASPARSSPRRNRSISAVVISVSRRSPTDRDHARQTLAPLSRPRSWRREDRVVVAQRRRLEPLRVLGVLAPRGHRVGERRFAVWLSRVKLALGLGDQRVHRPLRRPPVEAAFGSATTTTTPAPAASAVRFHPCPPETPVALAPGRVSPLRHGVRDVGGLPLPGSVQDGSDRLLAHAYKRQSKPALPRRYQRRYHSNPSSGPWNNRGNRGFPVFIGSRRPAAQLSMQKVEGSSPFSRL
jgi:hypothetical protein